MRLPIERSSLRKCAVRPWSDIRPVWAVPTRRATLRCSRLQATQAQNIHVKMLIESRVKCPATWDSAPPSLGPRMPPAAARHGNRWLMVPAKCQSAYRIILLHCGFRPPPLNLDPLSELLSITPVPAGRNKTGIQEHGTWADGQLGKPRVIVKRVGQHT